MVMNAWDFYQRIYICIHIFALCSENTYVRTYTVKTCIIVLYLIDF